MSALGIWAMQLTQVLPSYSDSIPFSSWDGAVLGPFDVMLGRSDRIQLTLSSFRDMATGFLVVNCSTPSRALLTDQELFLKKE